MLFYFLQPNPPEDEKSLQAQRVKVALDQIWEKFDTDGSGQIEKTEMRAILLDLYEYMGVTTTEEALDAKFKELDVDNNGSISKLEMTTFVHQVFNMNL